MRDQRVGNCEEYTNYQTHHSKNKPIVFSDPGGQINLCKHVVNTLKIRDHAVPFMLSVLFLIGCHLFCFK